MRNNSTITGQEPNITTKENGVSTNNGSHRPGTIKVIGIGPGNEEFMTPQAREAILAADRVVGYLTYLDLIADLIADKKSGHCSEHRSMYSYVRLSIDRCTATYV